MFVRVCACMCVRASYVRLVVSWDTERVDGAASPTLSENGGARNKQTKMTKVVVLCVCMCVCVCVCVRACAKVG